APASIARLAGALTVLACPLNGQSTTPAQCSAAVNRESDRTCRRTRLREHEKRLQKARAALLVGGGVDPTIALDSLAVLEETMRHFVFKARALEEERALRANKGEEADFGAVDKARAEAGRWAKEVAEYRHAKISAVKLAGDPNVVMPDNMTLDQLREAILSDVARLADVLEL